MKAERIKFPRIAHLPWSPGRSADDLGLCDLNALVACPEVVVTEKLDGENTTLYPDYHHARSTTAKPHPSRTWLARLHATIRREIPPGFRVCGENIYAEHSIHYRGLPSYFLVFAIFDAATCLSWDETLAWCNATSLSTVPVLYRGPWDLRRVQNCWTGRSAFDGEQEGYVVRAAGRFSFTDHTTRVAKYVRAHHVQTDEHWLHKKVVPNDLAAH